jgi:hypothetical protein
MLPRLAMIIGAVSEVLRMIEREPEPPEAVCITRFLGPFRHEFLLCYLVLVFFGTAFAKLT